MGSHFERARLLFNQRRYDLARQQLELEIAGEPEDPFAHALLALCLGELKQYARATEEAQTAISLGPDQPYCHYVLARIYSARNRHDEARQAILEAIRLSPDDADYFGLWAGIAADREDWRETLQAADLGLELNPLDIPCLNLRALALVKLSRKIEARAALEAALERDPDNSFTHGSLGWLLIEEGEPEKALGHFREALRLDPEFDWARSGVVQAMKARNPVYRWMLAYSLWKAKLPVFGRWAVIVGMLYGAKLLSGAMTQVPVLEKFFWLPIGLYVIFVVFNWVVEPLSNLILRLDRFGRLALSEDETLASNWFGALLLTALVLFGLGVLLVNLPVGLPLLVAGVSCAMMLLPISAVFYCEVGWPRTAMAIYTALVALCAPVGIIGFFAGGDVGVTIGGGALGLFFLGVVLSTWIGNFLSLVEVKH